MPGKPPFTVTVHESEEAKELAEIKRELKGREPKAVGDYVSLAIERVTLGSSIVPDDIGYYLILIGAVVTIPAGILSVLMGGSLIQQFYIVGAVLLFIAHTADVLYLHAKFNHKSSYLREWLTWFTWIVPFVNAPAIAYYLWKRGEVAPKGLNIAEVGS